MVIIPHNAINVQVSIPKMTDENQTICNMTQILSLGLTTLQQEAYALYDAGFNVFPQPIGHKGGLPWKRLQYSRLSRNDKNYGLRNLFAGECNVAVMCGITSNNLFVLDCESIEIFHYHLQQMIDRKLPIWAVKTARGGHIYLCAENGEVHNIELGILTDTEVKARNGYVLAPPSIHPSGVAYTWVVRQGDAPPIVDVNDIDWLKNRQGEKVSLTYDAPSNSKTGDWSMCVVSPASNLAKDTKDYLHTGGHLTEGSRNNRLFKAACDLSGNKYGQGEAEHILTPIALMSGLTNYEVQATIKSAYSRQRTPSKTTQAPLRQSWKYALLWATQRKWDNRTAGSDRALFIALIERARVSSNENDVFRASIRELSELSRLGTTTIQRGLTRLQEMQIIFNAGYDNTSQASLWRFSNKILSVAKQIELNLNTVSIPPYWLRYSESVFNSDIVERGALGHSVLFVYEFMRTLHYPMMPSDIAEALDISLNQVNYALRKLKEHELVQRLDKGWYLLKMTLPELEAVFEHVQGKGSERAEGYRREREVFAGVILFNARIKREGKVYMAYVSQQVSYHRQVQAVLDDPLLMLGLELGGVLRLNTDNLH